MARNVEFNEEEAIEKAMEVFWEKGYSAASMRDLTTAMQINSSSLYNTIGDKHALFVKCIKHYTESHMEQARKRARAARSPLNAIINLLNDSVNDIINKSNSCMIIKTTFEIANDDEEILGILKYNGDNTYQLLDSLLQEAKKQGELADNADPAILTDYLLSLITGWHESYILHQDPQRLRQMAQFVIKQLSQ
ncbi:TetR/AcrR family transcriptional regulator [Chitinophaga sp.]|uniref:TetR/AcrR family transcriptional regulator n=1 Tax=Chitinophaga sp. TaxID=1869181 RepID=UPI0031E0DE6A